MAFPYASAFPWQVFLFPVNPGFAMPRVSSAAALMCQLYCVCFAPENLMPPTYLGSDCIFVNSDYKHKDLCNAPRSTSRPFEIVTVFDVI